MKYALAIVLCFASFVARADVVDHLLVCPTEAACQADPAIGKYYMPGDKTTPGSWRADVALPNVSVYQVTGSINVTDPQTGAVYAQEQRKPYPGWYITITVDDPALDKHSALVDTTDAAMVFQPGFAGRPMAAVKATTATMKASGKIKPTAVQMNVVANPK